MSSPTECKVTVQSGESYDTKPSRVVFERGVCRSGCADSGCRSRRYDSGVSTGEESDDS